MHATSTATDYAVPTGEYVVEWLDENRISQAELARRMGVSAKHVSKLIAGALLSAEVATKLQPAYPHGSGSATRRPTGPTLPPSG